MHVKFSKRIVSRFRELKEEWIKAKYVDKVYFAWSRCIENIPPLDERILRALDKVPGHHVDDTKRKAKKIIGRRRTTLKDTLFRRFSKTDKKNIEAFKKLEKSKVAEEKASGQSSGTTSPELSPVISRTVPPRSKSPSRRKSPFPDSSDESGISFKERESENLEDNEESDKPEETAAACPSSFPLIKGNHTDILKAKLTAVDRNSIGSCYDNILVAQQQDDIDSEASADEADVVSDFLESDVEPVSAEGGAKGDYLMESDGAGEDELSSRETRAKEILKGIPPNLVGFIIIIIIIVIIIIMLSHIGLLFWPIVSS